MTNLSSPFYAKATLSLLGLLLVVLIIYLLQGIVLPFLFALIFAILLNPVEQWLERHHVPRLLAISLTVGLGFVVLAGIVYFLYYQTSLLSEQFPQFKAKLQHSLAQLQAWLRHSYGISPQKQAAWLKDTMSSGTTLLMSTLTAVTGFLIVGTLIPVYIFLLLLYRPMLIRFIIQLFARHNEASRVQEIMLQSKTIIQSYMVGLMIETAIVATLNSVGLLLLGIEYALLLGIVGAIVNLIPYLGGVIAVALPVLMAFVTKDSLSYPLGVVAVYLLIQFIDNHFLIPKIVASKIKVNALVAIMGVLVGNAIGGIAGMFLALPVIAILKIIFDRIEELKPWGMLLGDESPTRRANPIAPRMAGLRKRKEKAKPTTQ